MQKTTPSAPASVPLTRAEIAQRAKEDPVFRDGLLAAAQLILTLASGRTNV